MSNVESYKKIIAYLDLIKRKPKHDVKFFYFDDEVSNKFIMDGSRLKLIPTEYTRLYAKEEFHVQVNVKEQKVLFYAYDVKSYTSGDKVNEEQGYLDWDKVETPILNFLTVSIKELSDAITPYNEISGKPDTSTSNSRPPYKSGVSQTSTPNYSGYSSSNGKYTAPTNPYTTNYGSGSPYALYGYGTQACKDREAFFDKMNANLKDNKTSFAMDIVISHLTKMCEDKKFEELDYLFKQLTFDKLNIPVMLGILSATQSADKELKERKDFFNKVKAHITKVKPSRINIVMKDLSCSA